MINKLIPCTIITMICFLAGSSAAFDKLHGSHGGYAKINYDSLFNLATPLDQSPEGKELVDQCLEAYGGMEHLKALKSFRLEYAMQSFLVKDDLKVEKFYDQNHRYKIIKYGKSNVETRILNQAQAWYTGRDTTIVWDGGKYRAELFSYLTLSMPLGIKTESFSETRYGTRDDDSLSYIYMKKHDSLMIVIGIGPTDKVIVTSEGIIYQDSSNFVFVNRFSEFEKQNGYIFAGKLVNISMGLEVARSKLVAVEINPLFEDKLFKPTDQSKESMIH